jgi:hypothetical protein
MGIRDMFRSKTRTTPEPTQAVRPSEPLSPKIDDTAHDNPDAAETIEPGALGLRHASRPGQRGFELVLPPLEMSQANYAYGSRLTPFHGFAAKLPIAERAEHIEPLTVLRVARDGNRWAVSDADGILGYSRWSKGDIGRPHAQLPSVDLTPPADGWVLVLVAVTTTRVKVDIRGVAGEGQPPPIQLPDGRVTALTRPALAPSGADGGNVAVPPDTDNRGFLNKERESQILEFDAHGVPNVRLEARKNALHIVTDNGEIDPASLALQRAGIYSFRVRGSSHFQDATEVAYLRPGKRVLLVPEPTNPHDPNAVAVHAGAPGGVVGYVNKVNAKRLTQAHARGEAWEAVGIKRVAAW